MDFVGFVIAFSEIKLYLLHHSGLRQLTPAIITTTLGMAAMQVGLL